MQLERHVIGYPVRNGNEFLFESALNQYLPGLIEKHSGGMPVLVFCPTRRGTQDTALRLSEKMGKCCAKTAADILLEDKKNLTLAKLGIAYHHAGLPAGDRQAVEAAFRSGRLKVVCCTSTLATGVNLPARLVIVKSTMQYSESGYAPYDDSDVIQMTGRAGRQGLDTTGVCVVMTSADRVEHYKGLCSGTEVVDSCLGDTRALAHCLNAEAVLGSIHDMDSAIGWLRDSFMFVRMQRDYSKYGLGDRSEVDGHLRGLIRDALELLAGHGILSVADSKISTTGLSRVMSRYHLEPETVSMLGAGLSDPSPCSILKLLSRVISTEGSPTITKRQAQEIRSSAMTRYILDDKSDPDRVFYSLQLLLDDYDSTIKPGALQLARSHKDRALSLLRACADIAVTFKRAKALRLLAETMSHLRAETWPDGSRSLQQVPRIGKAFAKTLAGAGIFNLELLRGTDSQRIEVLLERKTPFGHELLEFVNKALPTISVGLEKGRLDVRVSGSHPFSGVVLAAAGDKVAYSKQFKGGPGPVSVQELLPNFAAVTTISVLFDSVVGLDKELVVPPSTEQRARNSSHAADGMAKAVALPPTPVSSKQLMSKPAAKRQRPIDFCEYIAQFKYTSRGERACIPLAKQAEPTGYTKKELEDFKRASQDSFASLLEYMGY